MANWFDYERIMDAVEAYRDAVDVHVCARIDAACCGASIDLMRLREADTAEYNARKALARIVRSVVGVKVARGSAGV